MKESPKMFILSSQYLKTTKWVFWNYDISYSKLVHHSGKIFPAIIAIRSDITIKVYLSSFYNGENRKPRFSSPIFVACQIFDLGSQKSYGSLKYGSKWNEITRFETAWNAIRTVKMFNP